MLWLQSYKLANRFHNHVINIILEGNLFYFWTGLVSLCVIYNAISIPLRFTFDYTNGDNIYPALIVDYLFADLVYILDILLIQTHLSHRDVHQVIQLWLLGF